MEIINSILVLLFFYSWNEYDFIIFQKKFSVINWLTKDKNSKFYLWYFTNRYNTKSWWIKNVFVFLLDGMHLNSSGFRFIGFFFFAQLIFSNNMLYWAFSILLYFVTGVIHSIMNKTLLIGLPDKENS